MSSLSEVLGQLCNLKLNVIPTYAEDDDEGMKDIEDYRQWYESHINEAILTTTEYIHSLTELYTHPDSHELFTRWLECRDAFIKFLPFTYDEWPNRGDDSFDEFSAHQRKSMQSYAKKLISTEQCKNNDEIMILKKYLEKLVELKGLMKKE
ncbi:MAG: hypothetical protein R3C11_20005 [Planctomycetaceae bacterium]